MFTLNEPTQFLNWSTNERLDHIQKLILSSSTREKRAISKLVLERIPLVAVDFTCILPRIVSLYIFSFLDPRSLSRAAQVSPYHCFHNSYSRFHGTGKPLQSRMNFGRQSVSDRVGFYRYAKKKSPRMVHLSGCILTTCSCCNSIGVFTYLQRNQLGIMRFRQRQNREVWILFLHKLNPNGQMQIHL